MKCYGCRSNIDRIYIQTCYGDKFCQEACMHDYYTEEEIDWLLDKELAWWQEYGIINDSTNDRKHD